MKILKKSDYPRSRCEVYHNIWEIIHYLTDCYANIM